MSSPPSVQEQGLLPHMGPELSSRMSARPFVALPSSSDALGSQGLPAELALQRSGTLLCRPTLVQEMQCQLLGQQTKRGAVLRHAGISLCTLSLASQLSL